MRLKCPQVSILWLTALALLGLLVLGATAPAAHPATAALGAGAGSPPRAALGAGAGSRSPAALPAVDTVQIGPIPAGDGFAEYVTEQGCGSTDPYFQVAFLTGSGPEVLSHTYAGIDASCSIVRSPGGAQLEASLPGTINIHARISDVGAALVHPGLPVGCSAPFGPELPATATGRIDVAVHPGVFGRLNASHAAAQIFSGAPQQCPAVQPVGGRELTADVGPFILDAVRPVHGSPQLAIYDAFGDDLPSGLTGTLELALSGPRVYDVTGTDGTAEMTAPAPLATGSLGFVPVAACPGDTAQDGTLSGTLTIDDPLLGALAIVGGSAESAFSGIGAAQAGTCDGPGSEPMLPDLVSSCDQVNAACSVAAGTNTATFFDETDPGSQSISTEAVNFGDGSPPVTITPGASVQHTYAQPGVYTATLAVRDAVGTTATATATVFIEA
jgi:hypothetical protein